MILAYPFAAFDDDYNGQKSAVHSFPKIASVTTIWFTLHRNLAGITTHLGNISPKFCNQKGIAFEFTCRYFARRNSYDANRAANCFPWYEQIRLITSSIMCGLPSTTDCGMLAKLIQTVWHKFLLGFLLSVTSSWYTKAFYAKRGSRYLGVN